MCKTGNILTRRARWHAEFFYYITLLVHATEKDVFKTKRSTSTANIS